MTVLWIGIISIIAIASFALALQACVRGILELADSD